MDIKDDRRGRWLGSAFMAVVLALGVAGAAVAAGGNGVSPHCIAVPEPMWFDLFSAGLLPLGFVLGRRTLSGQQ